jgi:hypothetical protein
VTLLAVLAVTGGAASCGGATDADGESHVSEMRLQVGGQLVTVTGTGAVVGEAIVLRIGVPVAVTAVFTDAFEVPNPMVANGDYRLDVEVPNFAIATYTAGGTSSLSGTLVANVTSTGTTVRFSLYHISKQHIEWGPFEVTIVTVN